ncbi:MAG: hypothetical protein ACRBM6_27915 [Geminicoccales bacterium]
MHGCKEALELYKKIETIKEARYAETVDDIRAALDRLKQSDENAYRRLLDELSSGYRRWLAGLKIDRTFFATRM